MLLEDAVYIILRDSPAVGAVAGNRIFAGTLPQQVQGGFPAMFYEGGVPVHVDSLGGGVSLCRMRFIVRCIAETYRDAALLRNSVVGALDEFCGTVSNDESPVDSIAIQRISCEGGDHNKDDQGTQGKPGSNLHEFLTEFEAHYLDPDRITDDPDT